MATFTYTFTPIRIFPSINDNLTNFYFMSVTGVGNALVTGVSVTIDRLNHTFSDDIDFFLRSPGDRNLLFMSDVRGSDDLVGTRLTFRDGASAVLGDASTGADVASGTYRPVAYDNSETVASLATEGTLAHATSDGTVDFASVFGGALAAGDWRLGVADDLAGDRGSFISWSMSVSVDSSRSVLVGSAEANSFVIYQTSATSGEFYDPLTAQTVVFSGVSGFDIDGGDGDDLIVTGSGNDMLRGGANRDRMYGGAGNDSFLVRASGSEGELSNFEIYDGGSGTDLLSFFGIDGGFEDLRLVTLRSIEALSLPNLSFLSSSGFRLNADQLGAGLSLTARITAPDDSSTYRMVVDNVVNTTIDLSGLRISGLDEVEINGRGVSERITGTSIRDIITDTGGNDSLYGGGGNDALSAGGGNDLLNGGTGDDSMAGSAGNDTYLVDSLGDSIAEGAGQGTADRVATSLSFALAADDDIEIFTTTSSGGTTAINLTGNALAQSIFGNAGANRINGLAGADTLTGGAGADRFVFSTATGAANIDTITDYNVAADTIALENTVFTGLVAGTLTAAAFRLNATGLAEDGSDRITYNSSNGFLYFDADGTGAGGRVRFAVLDAGLALTAGDFLVF